MTDPKVREARLHPDHAELYPGIQPGVWFIAATLAEHLDLRRERGSEGHLPSGPRALSADHFDFRGGERPVGAGPPLGRRPSD
jgi:hypothetical protein